MLKNKNNYFILLKIIISYDISMLWFMIPKINENQSNPMVIANNNAYSWFNRKPLPISVLSPSLLL